MKHSVVLVISTASDIFFHKKIAKVPQLLCDKLFVNIFKNILLVFLNLKKLLSVKVRSSTEIVTSVGVE
jgi:hypothetical protein